MSTPYSLRPLTKDEFEQRTTQCPIWERKQVDYAGSCTYIEYRELGDKVVKLAEEHQPNGNINYWG